METSICFNTKAASSVDNTAARDSSLGMVWQCCGDSFNFTARNPRWRFPWTDVTRSKLMNILLFRCIWEHKYISMRSLSISDIRTIVLGIWYADTYCRELHQVFQAFVIFNGKASCHPMGKLITSRKMNLPCRITGDINPSGSSIRLFNDLKNPFL